MGAAMAAVAQRLGRNRRGERGSREEWGRLEALGVVRNRTGDAGRLGAAVEELAVAANGGRCGHSREEEGRREKMAAGPRAREEGEGDGWGRLGEREEWSWWAEWAGKERGSGPHSERFGPK